LQHGFGLFPDGIGEEKHRSNQKHDGGVYDDQRDVFPFSPQQGGKGEVEEITVSLD
jgi:hypothetical protein